MKYSANAECEIKFGPSYAKRISYYEVIFHSFRKERISLKKTIALAIVFFWCEYS